MCKNKRHICVPVVTQSISNRQGEAVAPACLGTCSPAGLKVAGYLSLSSIDVGICSALSLGADVRGN